MQKVYMRTKSPDYSQAIFQTSIKIRLAFDYESYLPLVQQKSTNIIQWKARPSPQHTHCTAYTPQH